MIDGPCFYRSLLAAILIDRIVRAAIQYADVAQFRVNACEKSFLFDGAAAGIEPALLSEPDFELLLNPARLPVPPRPHVNIEQSV